ncbi:hypothetical protein AB1K89_15840 [Sporosarcina sp. 179-K 8C2 HS]|uniref:hypothetical protein n=1 Tax=Sporosarcina sp. 179-K 8C2 HS TaxID=3142387 RepID=UPI00399F65D6
MEGRALRKGDVLQVTSGDSMTIKEIIASGKPFHAADWQIAPKLLPSLSNHYEIKVIRGRQYELFDEESRHRFWNEPFTVSSQSDRMGYRISGSALQLKEPVEMISEAVTYGTIQVPPDGNPIVLAADRQTTGGYPKIGQMSSIDFTKLAQAKAGDLLSFKEVTIEQSQRLFVEQEMNLNALRAAIRFKFR